MIGALYTTWFRGVDLFAYAFDIFVLILIASYCIKYYKIRKEKNYVLLTTSFFLIAFSFFIKILLNVASYFGLVGNIGSLLFTPLTALSLSNANVFFTIGVFLHRFIFLMGLYFLYLIYRQYDVSFQSALNLVFIGYLLGMLTFFSYHVQFIFYLTSSIILVLLTLFYWKQYSDKKGYYGKKITIYSFSMIALSQIIFMFVDINRYIYLVGVVIELLGYSLLLLTFINILFEDDGKANSR